MAKPDWFKKAQKKAAAVRSEKAVVRRKAEDHAYAEKEKQQQEKAEKVIAGLQEVIEAAADRGDKYVTIMTLDDNAQTLGSLEGAEYIVALYCLGLGLTLDLYRHPSSIYKELRVKL